jgi:hypothetical protein
MRAVLAYAIRRTSARVVLALGIGGLVWIVYRGLHREGPIAMANGGGTPGFFSPPMSSPWELAVAAVVALVALAAAAVLYRRLPIRR